MRALIPILVLAWALPTSAAPVIQLANYRDGEEVRHSVPLLRGSISDARATTITVTNTSSSRDSRTLTGLIHAGQFKALADLVPGKNHLVLSAGEHRAELTLLFTPQTNPYFVRAVYLTDSSGDTAYQTPDPAGKQDYAGRIGTALLLMQTFTAERLYDLGFGRRTFNVELDAGGRVIVHLHKGKLAAKEYWAMNDMAWYDQVHQELAGAWPMEKAKNFVIAAYTRFDPATKKTRGHTALGGGGMGLFGSGNLYTWPATLGDVQTAFMDWRPIDRERTMNDSAGRNNYWGAASTTIGASLHEMAHTLGLPHTREPLDIMTRGFDRFNRAFTFVEPWHARPATEFKPDRVACFAPVSAGCMVASRWLALDAREWRDEKPTIQRDKPSGDVVIRSPHPIRYVNITVKGDTVHFIIPPAGLRTLTIPAGEFCDKVNGEPFRVRAINDQGNSAAKNSADL